MSEVTQTKKITDLTENTEMADTDIAIVGNAGSANLRRITWANIANAIKTKLGIGTASALETASKEVVGAINEIYKEVGDISTLETASKEVVGAINEIDATLGVFLKKQIVNTSLTLSASASVGGTVTCALDGYTPLGIIEFNPTTWGVVPETITINSTTINYRFRNLNTSAKTVNIYFGVLYMKTLA